VPHHPKDLLQSAVALKGDNLALRYLRDVRGALALHRCGEGAARAPPRRGVRLAMHGVAESQALCASRHLTRPLALDPHPTLLTRLSDGALVQEFQLPGIGSIGGFSGSRKGTEFFYSFQSEGGSPEKSFGLPAAGLGALRTSCP
jgi:hypothetical protein